MNKNVVWFAEVSTKDIARVGGKGANLGELTQAGISVPPGYIVTAGAYFDYLKKNQLDGIIKNELSGLNPEDTKTLQLKAKKIQNLILTTPMPQSLENEIIKAYQSLYTQDRNGVFVAVRSSATAEDLPEASFAGQQATFLNVSGTKDLIKAVIKCWASLFEARAIYYRVINKFDHMQVGIAVPIQAMVQAKKSGILFTIDPVKNDKSVITIDAGFGLGEAVVSGSITPDRYLVNKKDLKIISKEVNNQEFKIDRVKTSQGYENKHITLPEARKKMQKLTDDEIIELSRLGIKIEEHYNAPQDTEWAIDNAGKIYFVQSRPVTTVEKKVEITETDEGKVDTNKTKVLLKGAAASIGGASGPVRIIHKPEEIDKIQKGDVLVTEMTTPDFVPAMKRASAIVTDTGGRTCHAAIVSRELGIPCVVGTGKATSVLTEDQVITVDGANGVVYKGKVQLASTKEIEKGTRDRIKERIDVPITGTKVYVNLAEAGLAKDISQQPVDGVGLLRAEFMIADIGEHPMVFVKENRQSEFIEKLVEKMTIIVKAFNPRPVVYRTTDFKTNEYRNLKGGKEFEPEEENPMIGFRGAFRYLKQPKVFQMELEAIKKIREDYKLRNLWIMIPFVRTVEELEDVIKLVKASGLEQGKDFKLWMMVEVPSNVIKLSDFIAAGIDGVSIGTNDLTQLVLGLDRDSQAVAEEFDERNSAVVDCVKEVIKKCRQHNITSSICGQAPSVYPEFTQMLVEAGITSVSVNPDMIIQTRRLIASIEKKMILSKITTGW
jgi:pyruvate,water dikinase